MAKLFEKVDDNPGSYFGMLVENWKELNESVEDTVSRILSKEISQPRKFRWLSNDGTSGEVEYNGTKYAFRKLDNGKYKVMPSSKAGWNWSETLFKDESLKEDKFVPRDKMSKKAQKELNDKKRGTWGNTNPATRVQPNKKAYDRKRDKKELDEALTEDSEVFKDMSNALDDIEYLCNDTYNWGIDEWNDKENVKRTAERIIESAQVLLDSIKKY